MRIAIDIDSTLHHYWDQFEAAAKRRFGVELPYEDQLWHIDRLRPEQVKACVAGDPQRRADPRGRALPATPSRPSARGRRPATSSTSPRTATRPPIDATERWLEAIGLPYDELYCSWDKVARCREIGIELLIDDSPVNLEAAVDAGLRAATLAHPWNRDVCEEEDIVCAPDWPALARALEPILQGTPR